MNKEHNKNKRVEINRRKIIEVSIGIALLLTSLYLANVTVHNTLPFIPKNPTIYKVDNDTFIVVGVLDTLKPSDGLQKEITTLKVMLLSREKKYATTTIITNCENKTITLATHTKTSGFYVGTEVINIYGKLKSLKVGNTTLTTNGVPEDVKRAVHISEEGIRIGLLFLITNLLFALSFYVIFRLDATTIVILDGLFFITIATLIII